MFGISTHQTDFCVSASECDILLEIQVHRALFKSSGSGTTVFVLMYLLFLWVNGWHSVFVGLPAKLWSGNWVCFKVECFRQCFNCTRANSINIHSSIKLFSTISTYSESICIAFSKFVSLVFKRKNTSETLSSLLHAFKLQNRCRFLKVISLFLSKWSCPFLLPLSMCGKRRIYYHTQFYASSRWFNWTDAMEDMLTGTFPMPNVLTKANSVSFNSFS